MSKNVVLDWNLYFQSKIVPKSKKPMLNTVRKVAATIHLFLIPKSVFAAAVAESTWNNLLTTVWNIGDWLCVGVIIFSGITWMFGNRTKAIESMIGGSSGYIIVRHAVDIRNWLKTI